MIINNKLKLLLAGLCLTICGSFNANALQWNNGSPYIEFTDGQQLVKELRMSFDSIMDYIDNTNGIDYYAKNHINALLHNIYNTCTQMEKSNYTTNPISHTYMLLISLRSTLDDFRANKKISGEAHQTLYTIVNNMITKVHNINKKYNISINASDIKTLVDGLRSSCKNILNIIKDTPYTYKNGIRLNIGYIQQSCTRLEQEYTTHNINEIYILLKALKRCVLDSNISDNVYNKLIKKVNDMMDQINNFKTKYYIK